MIAQVLLLAGLPLAIRLFESPRAPASTLEQTPSPASTGREVASWFLIVGAAAVSVAVAYQLVRVNRRINREEDADQAFGYRDGYRAKETRLRNYQRRRRSRLLGR
jgi:hypothetical protein